MITQEKNANGEESGKHSSEQKGKNQENILQSKQGRIREMHSQSRLWRLRKKFSKANCEESDKKTFSNHQSDQFQSDAEIGGFQEEMWECVEDHHLEKEGKQQTGKRGASMCCKREGKGDGRWYIRGRVSGISLLQWRKETAGRWLPAENRAYVYSKKQARPRSVFGSSCRQKPSNISFLTGSACDLQALMPDVWSLVWSVVVVFVLL